jgi:tetratricopeptide (TPR) repeat protein
VALRVGAKTVFIRAMIRQSDEIPGWDPKSPSPRQLLQSIERHLSKTTKRSSESKADQAQQLVYDAWEAATDEREQELIEQALTIDPTNVDALLYMARRSADNDENVELLRKIVALGEKNLGPKVFKEDAGHFWGFIETRPYMRARAQLAEALRAAGRFEEAALEYQAMLKLNPGDNQGVRYHLLPTLFMLDRLEEVRDLFQRYQDEFDFNTVFAWSRVLERFLSHDLSGASTALSAARKQNPAMQAYIKGHRAVPRHLPHAYSPGSRDEAICFAADMRPAWLKHPAALVWLEAQSSK